MIQLTEKAVQKVKEFAEAEGIQPSVRLKVVGGGCAGFKNDMYFDEITSDMDEIIEQGGTKIIVDQFSFQYLDGSTIDFIETEYTSGFKFLNPNTKGECGCGSSVSY
jgi:iron-sulfur cluster insertion protein